MQTPQTINDIDGKFIVDYCKEQGPDVQDRHRLEY